MKLFHFWLIAFAISLFSPALQGATFLFDATKAEMAGNADWVIDADLHNLKVSDASFGSGVPNVGGNESNPQRFPTPPASGITSNTVETYWQGCLSAWAIDLVKNGHSVETLPYNGRITWNDPTNPQDLTNYQAYVLCEPNIYFTATEKAAIIHFVQNGGGLFIVSDHSVADRNNDGSDAFQVLNDLMTNSVANNPFGISYNGDNIVQLSSNPDTAFDDPIIFGPAGHVTVIDYNNGSTMSIHTNQNPTARIAFWSSSTHATNNAMIAYATYGKGKVVAMGDSSPFDDGTGDPNDTSLFVDYPLKTVSDGTAILNSALWLAYNTSVIINTNDSGAGSLRQCILNAASGDTLTFAPILSGKTIKLTSGELLVNSNLTIDASSLTNGIVISGNGTSRVFNVTNSATVALNSLTIVNGRSSGTVFPAGYGAGILNQGSLTVTRCTLTANWSDAGGSIYNSGLLTVNESTMASNNAAFGGGILSAGTTVVNQSTVTANSATNDGGGIYLSSGTVTLSNSIVAGNFGPTNANLHDTVPTGISLTGANLTNGDPHLIALANYGGPTPTMPPLPLSPAIDACTNGSGFLTDQAGFPRVLDGDHNGSAVADIGAAEANWPEDSFGYTGFQSVYAFEDISATGTRVLTNDDDTSYSAPIGFSFTFYGRSYTNTSFTPNGLITFIGTYNGWVNENLATDIPSGNFPSIAVLWDDWAIFPATEPGADAVYYQTLGTPGNRRFIVQWNNVFAQAGSPSGITFEATLYETNGTITCQYKDVDTGESHSKGASATVGIRDTDGELNGKNVQWSFNQAVISPGQSISFTLFPTDPTILTQPQDATFVDGTTGTYAVTATGSGALTYQWQLNGENLFDDGYNLSGANTPTLSLSNFSFYGFGDTLVAVVSTAAGRAASAFATLTVVEPAVIYSDPVGQTKLVGDDTAFSVGATGDQLTYQWYANAQIIAGATDPTLTVTDVQLTDNGTIFTVVVSNFVNSVTSAPALLAVRNPQTFVVTSAEDDGPGSLREALTEAVQDVTGFDTIKFATNISVIVLTNGELVIDRNIAIDASALPNGIQINGNANGAVFFISGEISVMLDSLTITNGSVPETSGGGIYNQGTLTMNRCTVVGNYSGFYGGGIYNTGIGASLTLDKCLLYNNFAPYEGGALYTDSYVNVTNTTFTANTSQLGGACFIEFALGASFNQVTITGNSLIGDPFYFGGGGILKLYCNVTLANCIVAGNSGSPGADIDAYDGSITFQGNNIIQDFYNDPGSPDFTNGPPAITADPLLAPLGNHGGLTLTMPPQFGSPAIDAGPASDSVTDQRGYPRPSGSGADLGAVEVQFAPTNNPPVLVNAIRSPIDQTFRFTFTNVPQADFSVLSTTDLAQPLSNWFLMSGPVEITPGQYQFIQNSATNTAQFYRVVSP